jgi:hypothetical protein
LYLHYIFLFGTILDVVIFTLCSEACGGTRFTTNAPQPWAADVSTITPHVTAVVPSADQFLPFFSNSRLPWIQKLFRKCKPVTCCPFLTGTFPCHAARWPASSRCSAATTTTTTTTSNNNNNNNNNILTRVGFERTTFCARSQVTYELHRIALLMVFSLLTLKCYICRFLPNPFNSSFTYRPFNWSYIVYLVKKASLNKPQANKEMTHAVS